MAKQLRADAGVGPFDIELRSLDTFDIPDLTALLKNYFAEIGVNISINITDGATYYGDGVFGSSPWLDSTLSLVDYGHRPVPNVYFAAFLSDGTWNAAHFKNPTFDQLAAEFTAALDLDSQRALSKQLQELLLDETPVIFPYFYNFLSAAKPNLQGAISAATGQFDLSQAGFTA
jgi:peptide/nickel transport system substrate-binding protein